MQRIRRLSPPGPVYADDYNAMAAEVERLGNIYATGADVYQSAGGILLAIPEYDRGFWARVTFDGDVGSGCSDESGSGASDNDCDGGSYSFVEVEHARGGRFETRTGGRTGECYEVNRWRVPDDTVVWMREGWAKTRCGLIVLEHVFQYEGRRKDDCDGSGSGTGSGSGCTGNADGAHGPVYDICCVDGSLQVVYEDDLE
jgi:hypothetical protein